MRRSRSVLGSLLLAFVVAGCARRDAHEIVPLREPSKDAGQPEKLPEVRTTSDVATFDHQRAVVFGTYDVEPVHPHKKGGRMTTIVLSDGTHVYRAYGWMKAETAFVNKRVKVTGVVTKGAPDPMMQSVSGPHVQPERIELAEGETAAVPVPTVLPTPPMVTSMPGFAPHVDRWVAVNATVDSVLTTSASWGAVILKLPDGALVDVDSVYVSEWKPLLGKSVTVIGRAHLEATDAAIGMRVTLYGAGSPCPGVEPRCGMDLPDD